MKNKSSISAEKSDSMQLPVEKRIDQATQAVIEEMPKIEKATQPKKIVPPTRTIEPAFSKDDTSSHNTLEDVAVGTLATGLAGAILCLDKNISSVSHIGISVLWGLGWSIASHLDLTP